MSEPQSDLPEPRQLRASNSDRERVAKVLHDAMADGRLTIDELEERLDAVYAAKTFGELEPVVRDLPVELTDITPAPRPVQRTSPAVLPTHAVSHRIGGQPTSRTAIAIMSGVERTGNWVVPATFNAFAMMGGIEIDLTDATFEAEETVIQASAIMGGIEIYVPEDVIVRVSGTGFMGAFESRVRDQQQGPPGTPVIRVTGFALMAGIEVRRRRKRKQITDD